LIATTTTKFVSITYRYHISPGHRCQGAETCQGHPADSQLIGGAAGRLWLWVLLVGGGWVRSCGVLVADLRKYQVSITGTRAAPCAGPARISGATYLDIEKET